MYVIKRKVIKIIKCVLSCLSHIYFSTYIYPRLSLYFGAKYIIIIYKFLDFFICIYINERIMRNI